MYNTCANTIFIWPSQAGFLRGGRPGGSLHMNITHIFIWPVCYEKLVGNLTPRPDPWGLAVA